LHQALQQRSQEEGSTLFMTLLAAFGVLLYRYSGQRGLVVGTPIANRNQVEIEGLIGFFVNTLALPLDLAGNPSFRQLLARVREETLGAYAHQELPFEKLVEVLQPERDLSRTPLFQVMFSFESAPIALPPASSGLTVERLEVSNEIAAKFDFTLSLEEGEQGLSGAWAYSTDLFEAATIERMQSHFERLLASIAADLDQPISALSLLAEEERHTILGVWNESHQPYPLDESFPALFEAQVARTPEATALRYEGETLNYRDLNERINRLAHRLREAGVGPEALVALCLERSVEMVVGILALLKAGGAYLPLDPTTPTERLAFMLADSQAPLLLTQRSLAAQLPPYEGKVLHLDDEQEALLHYPAENPASLVRPEHLAYVIYTSGSTGRPKGTLINHRSLTNYLCWVTQTLLSEQVQHLPATTRVTFDASLKQLLAPLLTGRAVWLLGEEIVTQPDRLLDLLKSQPNTAINCVPLLWQAILEEFEHSSDMATPPISHLFLGGEAASPELLRRTFARLPRISVWNLYGPSEATANASAARLQPGDPLTIGHPIANTQLYLLDADLQPVPVGVPGELYIGGEGLARGYLNQPGLTAERFVPHPFATEAGLRLYRTGDLGRYLPDGSIEFMGRRDYQIKVRGFRVELGEIEAVLHEHPAIAQAIVTAQEAGAAGADKRLVAYIVPQAGQEEINLALPAFLREKLPEYMIPAHIVLLENLPLTATGKLDRKALPVLTWQPTAGRFTAPRTPTEESLAEIWAEVLALERVGVEESFFALGGHSLLATRCMSRIRQRFEMDLPLRILFEYPTIAALGPEIDRLRQAAQGLAAPPMIPIERGADLPLSFAQQRLWFLEQLEQGSVYHVPMLFRLNGHLDRRLLGRSFNEIIRRHEVLRSSLVTRQGQPVQRIEPALTLPLPLLDLRALPASEREAYARAHATEEINRPFDLARPPLLRALLIQFGDEEHLVVLTMHHIVSDAWSTEILLREVALLYEAYRAGQPSPLPELPIQYADFAAWQQQWLQGETLEAQLAYWREQLRGVPTTLELP
ncbi:MAG: amino acid adenylation domain-containing protein, partial [Ardenticatenales bacterium]|nr:amino acid adenylation domain-containing protein [Ardenticatenales bacterium]